MEAKKPRKLRTIPVARPPNRVGTVVERVTNYVEENPFVAVGLAIGVGVLATVLLRASGVNLARLLAPPPLPEDNADD